MMLFSNPTKKRFLTAWLMRLFLLMLLSGCSLVPDTKGNTTNTDQSTPLPTAGPTYSSLPGTRPFIDTWNGIHLFQSFDYDLNNAASIARYYDFVWGANPGNVHAFRSSNPSIFLSYYISFFRDSGIFGNQDAAHSLNYWRQVHPDWILYHCDRKTPAYEDGFSNVPFN